MKIVFEMCCGKEGIVLHDNYNLATDSHNTTIYCQNCENAIVLSLDKPLYKLANAWNSIANGEKE